MIIKGDIFSTFGSIDTVPGACSRGAFASATLERLGGSSIDRSIDRSSGQPLRTIKSTGLFFFCRMYRLLVDRLTHSHDPQLGSYTVASLGYRVYPDADTSAQVRLAFACWSE